MTVRSVWEGLLDLIAPRRCAGCDQPLDPGLDGFCAACAPLLERSASLGRAHAAYVFGGPIADAIRRFKYGDRSELARPLGALLAERALELELGRIDVVVPVPLHPARLRSRGFDQAALLARPVARALGTVLAIGALTRQRDTPAQAGLDRAGRRRNVAGAFRARRAIEGRVLLIDDVVTTGATLAACAAVLRDAGAVEIETLVLARAEP